MTQNHENSNLPAPSGGSISPYASESAFEAAQRMAKQLASSKMVPDTYRNNVADCILALELSHRIGCSPFVVMQNCHMISSKPSWGAPFLIGLINASGKYKNDLTYTFSGEGDDFGCVAWAETHAGERKESERVTIQMAKDEGWWTRRGSKWPTMTKQMLCYRAASFFSRLHLPEITLGLHTQDEVEDFTTVDVTATVVEPPPTAHPATPQAQIIPDATGLEPGQFYEGVIDSIELRQNGRRYGVITIRMGDPRQGEQQVTLYFWSRPPCLNDEKGGVAIDAWPSLTGRGCAFSFAESEGKNETVWQHVESLDIKGVDIPQPEATEQQDTTQQKADGDEPGPIAIPVPEKETQRGKINDWTTWGNTMVEMIQAAATREEVEQWITLNTATLKEAPPKTSKLIEDAAAIRHAELTEGDMFGSGQ